MRKRLFEAVLFSLLFVTASGLPAQHFTFRTYGTSDGLTNLSAHCITQTANGSLYVCTEDGLFRYDGISFQRVPVNTMEEPYITGAAGGSDSGVWFSAIHSLYLLNASGVHAVSAPADGLEFDLFASMAATSPPHEKLYFVSRHRLYVTQQTETDQWKAVPAFGGTFLNQHPELARVSFVSIDREYHLWLGCGNEICETDGNSVTVYGPQQGLPADVWRQAFVDSYHRLWVRSEHSLYRLDNGASGFTDAKLNLSSDMLAARNTSIVEDRQGNILLNLNAGVARLEGDTWHILRERTDLPPQVVNILFSDSQGSIWLGLSGHGMARWLGYNQVEDWTTINGLTSDLVWNFARDRKGRLWIATENNLESIAPGNAGGNADPTPQTTSDHTAFGRIQSVTMASDGHLWTGSDDGSVFDFDPETHKSRKIAQLAGIFQVLSDGQGRMWISSLNGLHYVSMDDPKRRLQTVDNADAPQGQVYEGVVDAQGAIWFLGEHGLFRLRSGQWTHIALPPTYHSVLSAQIALGHDGTLWLSGNHPALMHLRVRGDKAEMLDSVPWAVTEGVNVFLVATDQRGWIWAGTGEGLYIFNGVRWVHFAVEDGLVWNDINSSGFFNDSDGSIWIGTSGGVTHLLHPDALFDQEPLTVEIGDARIGNQRLSPLEKTVLSWEHRGLTARLIARDFTRESSISFRYRIVGIEEEWQELAGRELHYPPLPAGDYRLEVVAVDEGNHRASEPVSLAFTVRPPWWKTTKVRVAEILLGLLVCLLAWRWSVRMLVQRQRHLESLVQARTRELLSEKQELLKARQELEIQASHDSLTGILNRGAVLSRFEEELVRARREHMPLAICLLDIDHFKKINDTWGHTTGDCVLKVYAQRLMHLSRQYDVVGRYGGEEMIMVLPGLTLEANARLHELHHALGEEIASCQTTPLNVTCSIGVTWYQPGIDSVQSMIDRADKALYQAKREGRNRIVIAAEPSLEDLFQSASKLSEQHV